MVYSIRYFDYKNCYSMPDDDSDQKIRRSVIL